jgi:hypothetical protein
MSTWCDRVRAMSDRELVEACEVAVVGNTVFHELALSETERDVLLRPEDHIPSDENLVHRRSVQTLRAAIIKALNELQRRADLADLARRVKAL